MWIRPNRRQRQTAPFRRRSQVGLETRAGDDSGGVDRLICNSLAIIIMDDWWRIPANGLTNLIAVYNRVLWDS